MSFIGEAAMSFIAEAALSAFFEMLFEKLASAELLNFATEAKVYMEIKKWEKMLHKLRLVLDDAEEKTIQNNLVMEWLGEVKHLAYDVEDILDEFSTECLRRKVDGERHAASSSKIPKLIPACCTTFTPRAVIFNFGVMSKVKKITARFNVILEEMKELNLIENITKTSTNEWQRPPSTCLQDEPIVYGRDDDKNKMLELLKYETGDAKIGVIPIVGMGGLGKTTLAKLVYNDDSVDRDFQLKAWVCVSDAFDVMRVTKAILESITGMSSDLKEFNTVQLELKNRLAGKKFLLVLDDVWTEKHDDWDVLRPPFMDGAIGSKIIVTTRSAEVASMMGTVGNYDLKLISNEDCWALFSKYAFENRSIDAHPELKIIGRKLVNERCGGLPLAAKTLGGLLRSKQRREQWEDVLNNELWSKLEGSSDVPRALYLSYYYLPSHLKRCFAYCAVLPKDYEFKQEDIILLWMAEGLIPHGDEKRGMEDLGRDYFDELRARSMFQPSNIDESRFIMHDLVNDLAMKVAKDVCFRLEDKVYDGEISKWKRVRYSSYIQRKYEVTKRFAPFCNMKCLRTFLPLVREGGYEFKLASCVPCELVENLKFVRVLSFRCYAIEKLPDSIGNLKHLRHLDLSYTDIKVLPETTTLLYNLQTLILQRCRNLSRLPERMDNLIHLRHLNIVGTYLVEGLPLEIKQLSSLRSLPEVAIGKESFTIANLMNLKSLRGELSIKNLDNVVDASDALKARMNEKEGIHVLKLAWRRRDHVDEVQYGVLDALQPHKNLSELVVNGYAGGDFPPWIANSTHINMVHLRLEGCWKCMSLPQLGILPKLKTLFIKEMSSLQNIDRDFYGNNCSTPFPCLEVLSFEEMHDWEAWDACEYEFRALHELSIKRCRKLSGKLPIHLPLLEKLVIVDCANLVASLPPLPKLSTLNIEACKEVVFSCKDDLGSLNSLRLVSISSITNMVGVFLQKIKKFKELHVSASQTREHHSISNSKCMFESCPLLMSMVINEDKEHIQMEVENVTLKECSMLEKLPIWIEKLMLLKKLRIEDWPRLVTLPEGTMYQSQFFQELDIADCASLISFGKRQLPPTLKRLYIRNCTNLKGFLHEEDEGDSSSLSSINLELLEIWGCKSLTSISSTRALPATLKHLDIFDCSNLTCVLARGKLPSRLLSLTIGKCSMIESIAEGFNDNSSLQRLIIFACSSLKALPEGLCNLVNLSEFQISDCPCIVSFPEGGFSSNSLKILFIDNVEKLEALPDNLHRLSFLQKLTIRDCPELVSFPSEGLPSNLTSLQISKVKITKALFDWGLDRLNSLKVLSVSGGYEEMRRFPSDKKNIRLPNSLMSISISNFPNLRNLSTTYFSDITSLESLRISSCPKLASFPKNGLPDSLLVLDVRDCRALERRCKKGKGHEWSKILHIPQVEIWNSNSN